MNNSQWDTITQGLIVDGWGTIALGDDPVAQELANLRLRALAAFIELVHDGGLAGAHATSTGQYGATEDADEGEGDLAERRSHLVFNLGVPSSHPLNSFRPLFYGADVELPARAKDLATLTIRLHTLLDHMTTRALESLERRAGLTFGALSGPMALGERLLRFQWYPALVEGEPTVFDFATSQGSVAIRGRVSGERRVVWASPHTDTGHWTWQVCASDDSVRFWDKASPRGVVLPQGEHLTGNICDFLALELSATPAPVHWVDAGPGAPARASLSYFAHARPSAQVLGEPAGLRLYDRLLEMGYVSRHEVDAVRTLLAGAEKDDDTIVKAIVAHELRSPERPVGFAASVSRYYTPDGRLAPTARSPLTTR